MTREHTPLILVAACACLLAAAPVAPQWLVFLLTLALAKGLVVLGLLLLMRTGLVSFGQGLYFGLGAYAAALLGARGGVLDGLVMIVAAIVAAAAIAAAIGLLLARYREIFFAMLSLAFSMILYGLLVKSSTLGSTDGFNLHAKSFAGFALADGAGGRVFYVAAVIAVFAAGLAVHRYLGSHYGRLATAIRDNELRVEYLGASVFRVVYANYVAAGALGGLGARSPRWRSGTSIPRRRTGRPRASSCSSPCSAAPATWRRRSWRLASSRQCVPSRTSTRQTYGK